MSEAVTIPRAGSEHVVVFVKKEYGGSTCRKGFVRQWWEEWTHKLWVQTEQERVIVERKEEEEMKQVEGERQGAMEQQAGEASLERAREEVVLRFLQAYEKKNRTALSVMVQQAEQDHGLKMLLWEMVPAYWREEDHLSSKEAGACLQEIFEHSQEAAGAVSLARVAAQQQIDLAYEKELTQEQRANFSGILKVLSLLQESEEVVPDGVELCWVQGLFQCYGLVLPRSFAQQFLQTARKLSLCREDE